MPAPPPPVAASPSAQQRRAAAKALARLLDQGAWLMDCCMENNDHPPVHQAEDWCDAVADELGHGFGPELARRFIDAPPGRGPAPDASPERQRLWLRIQGRCDWLAGFTAQQAP